MAHASDAGRTRPERPCDPEPIAGLHEVAGRFAGLICDVWGVLTDGVRLFPEAADALSKFRATGRPIALLSNSARPGRLLRRRLQRLGLADGLVDAVVSAGDCALAVIEDRFADAAYAHIGPDFDRPLIEEIGRPPVPDPRHAAALLVTGPLTADIDAHRVVLEEPAARGAPMICANPDRWVRYGERLIPCAGLIADLYERLGGPVIRAGKPEPFCFELAAARIGLASTPERILVIGDGLETDIKGANKAGMRALWISHGLHLGELDKGQHALFKDAGACPEYVLDRLRW